MKIFLSVLLLLPILAFGQSVEQNYIKTTNYKVKTTNGIDIVGGGSVSESDKIVTVNYFDGLGKPTQRIEYRQAGDGGDIISHISYDVCNRQTRQFLPYVRES